jgi:hypothetical protein
VGSAGAVGSSGSGGGAKIGAARTLVIDFSILVMVLGAFLEWKRELARARSSCVRGLSLFKKSVAVDSFEVVMVVLMFLGERLLAVVWRTETSAGELVDLVEAEAVEVDTVGVDLEAVAVDGVLTAILLAAINALDFVSIVFFLGQGERLEKTMALARRNSAGVQVVRIWAVVSENKGECG